MRVWSKTVLKLACFNRSKIWQSSCFCFSIPFLPVAWAVGQSKPSKVVIHTARISCLGKEYPKADDVPNAKSRQDIIFLRICIYRILVGKYTNNWLLSHIKFVFLPVIIVCSTVKS